MKLKMKIKRTALESGARLYLKALPWSSDLAGFMLMPVEKLNGTGKMVRVIRSAQKQDHPLFKVLVRLATEINPRCKSSFLSHHMPLLIERNGGNKGFFPKVLIISVTSRCNYACPDCFNNTFSEKSDLPPEVLDRILFEAEEKGTKIVALSGGEPLTRIDLFDIIERHPGLYFQIFTNGSLISDEIAKRMARLGNVMPFISLEGDKTLTDKRRGVGCYQKVFKAMKHLKRNGIIFGSNVMVTSDNFDSATSDEFVKKLVSAGAMAIWYITYRPVGKEPDPELVLSRERHFELYRRVLMIRNTWPVVALENLHDVSYFGGCPAKLGVAIHIDHKGNVTPCPPLHFSNQNIIGQTLEEALAASPFIEEIMNTECSGCIILEEPSRLEELVLKTGAVETGEEDELKNLRSYTSPGIRDLKKPFQTRTSEDIYGRLMEVFRDG